MVLFFHNITTTLEVAIPTGIAQLQNLTGTILKLVGEGKTYSLFLLEMVARTSLETSKYCWFVYRISDIYYRISQEQIMPQMNWIYTLRLLDGAKNANEIQSQGLELINRCESMGKYIMGEAEKSFNELHEIRNARLAAIEQTLKELPLKTEDKTREDEFSKKLDHVYEYEV